MPPDEDPKSRTRLWTDRLLPRVVDASLGGARTADLRAEVCAGLRGAVLELGFGSGPNVPFYPAAVTGVTAVDPSEQAWRLAAARVAASPVPIRRGTPSGSYDAALSTWTLCTIPDVATALAELRRLLRPGAEFHFVEHGLAPDEGVRRWQRRLEPLQKRVFGGCHLTRPTLTLLESAGFTVVRSRSFYEPGTPRPLGALTLGVAVRDPAR